jgi:hypothetical protein
MLYYQQFYPNAKVSLDNIETEFRRYFNRHYGRRHYLIPVTILSVLVVICIVAASRTLQVWQKITGQRYALPYIAVSAIAGGFAWVIYDLIDRLRRRDFTVSDIYNASFRILVAIPFGWAVAQVAAKDAGVPLAFLLGAFPTSTLFTFARRLASTKLGISDDPASGGLELEKLQGLTKTNAERFYDESISTIVQLAHADPIDLAIRTNFDLSYVIDCINQALLWIYFGDKVPTLSTYSLRGAQEASVLFSDLTNPLIVASQPQAVATLNSVASVLGIPAPSVQRVLETVARDPYSMFISSIWH